MPRGKLYGIGVGPGDPELLTIKAKKILEEVEVLFIPKSKQETRSLALSIVTQAVDKDWECYELLLPMTKDQEILQQHWQEAARQITEVINTGRDAAFITLGDPSLYSSLTYLLRSIGQINPEIDVKIIPGVSSLNSVAAWIQQPLAEGDESLLIIPAGRVSEDIGRLLDQVDNIFLLKAGREVDKIRRLAEDQQTSGRVYLASRCGFPDGFYTTDLKSLDEQDFNYLTSLLIKKNRKEG
ncbi:Cobalamin (vitamin B12) biosynthesis CobI/CbiL, precorrin-2 C20-methyltransferase [Syntrophomonas zehnderi OL-4]|uniref:Cobalamin (Vitamin B12) biosynthesis CobI/CbiL, precorrin-2 C20-methyltransferase n=1 Tax=Syntrophomonas zehnderi OL-4 TaxID=690567 RepID=A0A0E4GFD2_9FIRM|nr:precorrin-2 C(20)-methyltransferase [Syntrophomonas zehnderi]CFY07037.1 Cobalamin (vitamin B12) biosynthesis CobI/CbiL, precorrin-2 C20-methyltransferase [Syntrophomonas zehnderi OL-4]